MVNMLTQQIDTMFNPLIQNTKHSYHQLAHRMSQIVDLFGAPQVPIQPVPNNPTPQQVIPVEPPTPKAIEGNAF